MKASLHKMVSGTYRAQTFDYIHSMIVGKGTTIEEAKEDLIKNIQSQKEKYLQAGLKVPYQLYEKIEYINNEKFY